MGRTLIILGIVLVVMGVAVSFGDRLPLKLGRLPGDVVYQRKNTTVYFPIVTSILLSVVLTLVMWLFGRNR